MKNTAIRIITVLIFILLGWRGFKLEEPPTFYQSCLLFIVLLLGLQIFKE